MASLVNQIRRHSFAELWLSILPRGGTHRTPSAHVTMSMGWSRAQPQWPWSGKAALCHLISNA